MPVPRQSIIMLRGTAGSGKTAILQAMQDGLSGLLCEPFLTALAEGWAYVEVNALAVSQGAEWSPAGLSPERPVVPLRPALEAAGGDAPWIIVESCVYTEQLAVECAGAFDLWHVWLVAPSWLVEARRQHRFATHTFWADVSDEHNTTMQGIAGQYGQPADVDYALQLLPDATTLFVATADWPLKQITPEEARAMLEPCEPGPPVLEDYTTQYQQCLRVKGEWYGNDKPWRRDFEAKRLDLILPADCTGLDVLDIGASDGGFCWEALHRGARQCMAVELRPDRIALMKNIRNRCQLPVTTAQFNIVGQPIPVLHAHGERKRFGLTLLLNVLHHLTNPDAVLRRLLDCSDRLVLETPFGIGLKPYKPGLPPYPNALHLPPAWVEMVAGKCGFRVTAIRVSNMTPGQRLIFDLQRETNG